MQKKRIAILGSTGSIGVTTLDIIERFPERFSVIALAAGKNVARLVEQVRQFKPRLVALADPAGVAVLRREVPEYQGEILVGADGLQAVATLDDCDLVVAGLVGALGLLPTLAALRAGNDVALANKEALVVAGQLMTDSARAGGARLWPIDSEHNAIFQSLHGHRREDVARIVLTASGGPFRNVPAQRMATATRAEALRHPTWKMGDKITIDCATLMNKGLEVIEAHWLFDLPSEQIDVVIHPQSVVHSMVEYVDGSVIAQLGIPDMAVPISFILAYPERLPMKHLPRLDLPAAHNLEFLEPDRGKFPCLDLAYRALQRGGIAPAVLNAANEVAVNAFLEDAIRLPAIADTVAEVLEAAPPTEASSLEALLDADRWARQRAEALIWRDAPVGATGTAR